MKNKILILFLAVISLSACKKDEPTIQAETGEPKVISATFFQASAGSNITTGCKVKIEIPIDVSIKTLIMAKEGKTEGATVQDPKTGEYTIYDPIGDYQLGRNYYFIFKKSDNTVVISDIYKVK